MMTNDVPAWQAERFDALAELIEGASTIATCAHTSPDGDALGSQLALSQIIAARWPDKQVTNLLADLDPVPRIYRFLPGADGFVHVGDYDICPDLLIYVDLGLPSRSNEAERLASEAAHVAVIDHHPCDEPFGDVVICRPDAAAAGVLVTEFADHLGVALTPDIAQSLFCAVATDTGRFQYQNSDGEAFRVASRLVDAGADPAEVSLNVYQSFTIEYLRLEALVMSRIRTYFDNRLAFSYASLEDIRASGSNIDECDGLIDLVRSVYGTEVALFLRETCDGKVRGNLRSKSDLDVSGVARAMGGGGHVAAAGFTCDGTLDDVLAEILPKLQALIAPGTPGTPHALALDMLDEDSAK